MVGGFHKSEGKPRVLDSSGTGSIGGNNPATKKYLEQMEKIYSKRTESTG
jgi:hypothetical protein